MNKPLIIIVIVSTIYLLTMALSSNAQRIYHEPGKLKYGYVEGKSDECDILHPSKQEVDKLHYVVQKSKKQVQVKYFCVEE